VSRHPTRAADAPLCAHPAPARPAASGAAPRPSAAPDPPVPAEGWRERLALRVAGKGVLVTGAAGGIGAALVRHLASLGARVAALDRKPCLDLPAELCLEADIADADAVAVAVARTTRAFGAIEALVNNAAVTDLRHHRVRDLPLATWDDVFRVNVRGSFVVTQAVLPHMLLRRTGNIVFVTSSLGQPRGGIEGDAVYSASKAAVEMLACVLAREVRGQGVNVNTVYPSVKVDTGFFAHLREAERAELAPPTLLNEPTAFLVGLPAGSLSGTSLSQQAWDDEPGYAAALAARAEATRPQASAEVEP
jgi:NAD(P)-dependent dehydrogenase (short-subunit alcohol dehydrogenase family)